MHGASVGVAALLLHLPLLVTVVAIDAGGLR
jgi:hypothetical protein